MGSSPAGNGLPNGWPTTRRSPILMSMMIRRGLVWMTIGVLVFTLIATLVLEAIAAG